MVQFDAIKIGIASPESILEWSRGEVTKPETINYRTLKPEKDGLFCEKIFGPTKDWECHCGKYKKIRYRGKICERCGVEVTSQKVRRERMGHIALAAPVSHIWYFKGIPSRMGLILDISPRTLEKLLYFACYVVIEPGDTPLLRNQILTEKEFHEFREKYGVSFKAGMGAEAVKELLSNLDLDALSLELRSQLTDSQGQKKAKIVKRLEVVEAFRLSGNRPEWMIIDNLPVIPPELRPMVQLDGGRFATSDLNDLYRRVINRNNRLRRLYKLSAPDIIVRNEKRMLQEAVDALIDNGKRGRAVTGMNSRVLKSLSDMLKGKQGRFRQNLLGKRVDYSGRSVIVVGPDLKLYQCGLPKEMAIELFRPFVMKKLVSDGFANNIKSAKKMVDRGKTEVWDALDDIIKEHPVLLNRAPTLHRLGIQAFEPVLVEGRALKLHPLVCTAYNADFDGDQMAVHVPLSAEAQAEARILMLSANNLLRPQDGKPVTVLSQDMILGAYYLTNETKVPEGAVLRVFRDVAEAQMAYDNGDIKIHDLIRVRRVQGETSAIVTTTIGRIIFNEAVPQDLGFVDRTIPGNELIFEIGFLTKKKHLNDIIDRCITQHGFTKSTEVLDALKNLGFKYSTLGAITISISDMTVPNTKQEIIGKTNIKVIEIEGMYRDGEITNDERYRLVIDEWERTTTEVTAALEGALDEFNPIYMMADSGARGSMAQIRQLAGMLGLMSSTSGKTIEIPIKANYREGLTVLDYFVNSRGARKGLADTALRTADSGYLTRRLVDVSQDVIIREPDCGTNQGVTANEIRENGVAVRTFSDSIHGRFPLTDIVDPNTGELLFSSDSMLKSKDAKVLEAAGIHEIQIRSVLACEAKRGVCAKCYGMNLATGGPVSEGEAVGVIAAQSIGEPGTQLTMRTFHTGGVAGDDITQGLPRVEELFEARKPKKMAILAEIGGKLAADTEKTKKGNIIVYNIINEENSEVWQFQTSAAALKAKEGDYIEKGQKLTDGALYPADVLRIKGIEACQNYLIQEVQKVYRQQGVDINDKHIEVIVRQMMRKVRVDDSADSEFLSGSTVDMGDVVRTNAETTLNLSDEDFEAYSERDTDFILDADDADILGDVDRDAIISVPDTIEDGQVTFTRLLMGITKASLATESWLSAASFQETTKVLTDAAIRAKVDHLIGLKENVIIGKLIPAGSGLEVYRQFDDVLANRYAEDNIPEITLSESYVESNPEEKAQAEAAIDAYLDAQIAAEAAAAEDVEDVEYVEYVEYAAAVEDAEETAYIAETSYDPVDIIDAVDVIEPAEAAEPAEPIAADVAVEAAVVVEAVDAAEADEYELTEEIREEAEDIY